MIGVRVLYSDPWIGPQTSDRFLAYTTDYLRASVSYQMDGGVELASAV